MIDLKVPTPGESITEVEIATWLVSDGDLVRKDQDLAEIESDKATLILNAPESGKIFIKVPAGEPVAVGVVACQIDETVAVEEAASSVATAPSQGLPSEGKESSPGAEKVQEKMPHDAKKQVDADAASSKESKKSDDEADYADVKMTPLAREKMKAAGLSVADVMRGLVKLTSADMDGLLAVASDDSDRSMVASSPSVHSQRTEDRKKMSQLRKKLSQRLVKVKNETAMLTTFNEVDMSKIIAIRKSYQKSFVEKHDIKLGFMSFFIKASALALRNRPSVNSMIDGDEIISPNYADISIAVQTPKGLMVPVIRDVHSLSLADIESRLAMLASKARSGRLTLDEMTGGTFTITNGGIFGSLLSTPLINPPQSAILGMHNIVERPIAVEGSVVVRPMMYIALSYDHRLIDGKDSVGFLMDLKKMLEDPRLLLSGGRDPLSQLLEL